MAAEVKFVPHGAHYTGKPSKEKGGKYQILFVNFCMHDTARVHTAIFDCAKIGQFLTRDRVQLL